MAHPLVEAFTAGAGLLAPAIKDLTPAQLTGFPVAGTWSIQQVVIHVMESDLVGTHRMKRIIAEERPLLIAYDETAFTRELRYERLNVADAIEIFRLNRLMTADILRGLPDAAFERWGVHNHYGKLTLADVVRTYTEHVPHHLKFVAAKRAALGVG